MVQLNRELRERANPLPGEGLTARVFHLTPGTIDITQEPNSGVGLLILNGLLMVQLDLGRGHIGWMVGANDLLCPWHMPELTLTKASSWRALTPTRVALLDEAFCARAGGDPAIIATMIAHTARTAHWLYAKSLIISCPVVKERLMLLFALLGERWGKVTAEGVALDLPLTHSLLATMCAARRPSVTLALRSLSDGGVLDRRAAGGWLLHRPAQGNGSLPVPCWSHYAETLGFC